MKRTQISLAEDQLAALRQRAQEQGVSIAALLREAVDALLHRAPTDDAVARSLAAVGSYRSAAENVAEDHDDFLDTAYRV